MKVQDLIVYDSEDKFEWHCKICKKKFQGHTNAMNSHMKFHPTKIVIDNQMELIALQQILEEYPKLLEHENAQLSAISNQFRRETLDKITQILNTQCTL